MGQLWSSAPKPKEGGRRILVTGAGESEANGVYVECARPFDGKPQFVYSGRSRDRAPIVLWWAASGEQWSIRKDAVRLGSTSKLWYIASSATGADVSGDLPPSSGWSVSAKSAERATGAAAFSIEPAPAVRVLAGGEPVPEEVLRDMEQRGAQYAADGE
mmetsp:Transcript_83415/g.226080  ORF Transcript_83415/g.226080 Transcript_83415/m.226080 type:complete len:159 (-) Transcript_83415:29-505(-)